MSELRYEESLIQKSQAKENPTAYSHTEIKETFDAMNPSEAADARGDYMAIATGWEDAVTVFAARIRRSSESAWSGPAAETARQAISDYATDATNLSPALWVLAQRVDNMVAAVNNTKSGMPEVVHDPQSAWNPGDWFDGDGGVAEAERSAQVHMATWYVNPAIAADGQVPVLPQPRDPVAMDDGGTPGDTSTGGNPSGPGGAPTGPGIPGPQNPGEEQPGGEQPGEQQPTGEETAPGETQPASTDTAGTTPQTTVPGTPGSPAVTPSSTTTAGVPPGNPGSPAGTPGLGTPGPGAPGPGQTVSGAPAPAGAPATTAGPKTASGSPGMRGGMPMMGAPGAGRGGGGDNDGDRQTPDYLINEENTRELLGEEAPTIPGGVLGADAPSASPAERPPGY